MNTKATFEARIAQFKSQIATTNKLLDRIAFIRLGVFLAIVGVQVWSWGWGGAWWLLCLVAGIFAFALVVKWNVKISRILRYQTFLLKINEQEVARLDGNLKGFDEGAEFIDPLHPYSSDLDLFGHHSLFQLLSRATTIFGRQKLANWLQNAMPDEVAQRQVAATELAPAIDWRQAYEATGRMYEDPGERPESIKAWMEEPSLLSSNPIFKVLPFVMIAVLAGLIVVIALGLVSFLWIGALMLVNYFLNSRLDKQIKRIEQTSAQRAKVLAAYAELIAQIEQMPVTSPRIVALQAQLKTEGKAASAEIDRLARIVRGLELRSSGVPHFVANNLFFWDIYWINSLEAWKAAHGTKIMQWFDVIGEMEALSSLAALKFAFPEWTNPEVVEGNFKMVAEDMGHPLIPPTQRINNPIDLQGNGSIWLVTGSNMSGKSTYLRTVGINVVLALTGAPVCAKRLTLSPMQVATSMRTIDSLEENTSSFYAELKRLKSVIALVKTNPNTIFLLDEILKGTNSRDRHAGAQALIRQLHQYGGAGIVSTHDIELVAMADDMPDAITNYSFNCVVTPEGQLLFDYKLTHGQCLSMNATALMRAMGIEV